MANVSEWYQVLEASLDEDSLTESYKNLDYFAEYHFQIFF